MQRVKRSTAVAALPAPPVGGTPGYFAAPNPQAGVEATIPGYEWFNAVQEEILAVIVAAGLAPSEGNLGQLLAALRAAGVFQTPPQFDNDSSAATTEFVQRALGNSSGVISKAANGSLAAADAGKLVYLDNSTPFTLGLPSAASVPVGATFEIFNINSGTHTVQRSGADLIYVNNTTVASLIVGSGDGLKLVKIADERWLAVSGAAQLGKSAAFGSSLTTNGHKLLPGDFIFQWKQVLMTPTLTNFTWPISWPGAALCVIPANNNSVTTIVTANAVSSTHFSAAANNSSTNFVFGLGF